MRWAVLAALGLGALVAVAAAGDLAGNGGFEDGTKGWSVQNVGGTLELAADGRERKEGRASGHVTKSGGFAADWIALPVRGLPGGGKVTVAAWVKGRDLGNCWLKFHVFDAAGRSVVEDCDVQMLRGTFGWRKVERTFSLPEGAVRGEVRLCMFLGGEAWIDGVSVAEAGAEPRKPLDARTSRWLDENATPVETLDFDAPLTDLAPLRKRLEGVRIVQLGESSHGDGATQRAKARLVRFLHEEMGFTVLAFESGTYECDRANALLRQGKPREAMRAGLFKIWCLTETEPLFRYMAARAEGERPLVLAGFDPQATGEGARGVIDEALAAAAPGEGDAEALRVLWEALRAETYAPEAETRKAGRAALGRIRAALEEKDGAEAAFLARCLGNLETYEELRAAGRGGGRWESVNLRDARMADNLRWLAEVRYPGRKIVTWAATFHQAHGMTGISVKGDRGFYRGCRSMGDLTHEAFGKACYTIGFCAYGGVAGRFAPQGTLEPPAEGSLEDLCHRYGKPLLLLDLRVRGPFDRRMQASPMAHDRTMTARWSRVMDGVFYVEEMTATTYMGND